MPVKDTERGLFVVIRTDENVEGNYHKVGNYLVKIASSVFV